MWSRIGYPEIAAETSAAIRSTFTRVAQPRTQENANWPQLWRFEYLPREEKEAEEAEEAEEVKESEDCSRAPCTEKRRSPKVAARIPGADHEPGSRCAVYARYRDTNYES